MIRMTRDFAATPDQLMHAHTDPDLFAQWIGPDSITARIEHWDCRTLGSYRYVVEREGMSEAFRGTFPEVGEHRIVQTFCWEGMPEAVSLETVTFEDLGDGHTRLHAQSLCDSFEGRDAMLASGMETGVQEGYAKLDRLLAATTVERVPAEPAARHRHLAKLFGERVAGVRDWDVPTPVSDWRARDVVRHLIDWFPGFLAMGSDARLASGPSVDDDPVGAWRVHADGVQALLDDPATAASIFRSERFPDQPLEQVIDRFYTVDIFMHLWDLSVATGQDTRLDPDLCAELLDGMRPIEEMIRASGQFGERVEVSEDDSVQAHLLGFIGRDPHWSPPTPAD